MRAISASVAKHDLDGVIARVNEDRAPVAITGTKGKCAVLVGEEDWASIAETLASRQRFRYACFA
jgi:prevent-host-death family protein